MKTLLSITLFLAMGLTTMSFTPIEIDSLDSELGTGGRA